MVELKMKKFLARVLISTAFVVCIFSLGAFAEDGKNYVMTIDGKDYDINIDDTITVQSQKGNVAITLKRKEFSTFTKDVVSFEHRSDLSVAATDIDRDIHQYLLASALGTLIIVQKYDAMNPDSLNELMINQIAKDDIASGYKIKKSDFSRTLSDGTKMNGLRARLTYKKDDVDLQVLSVDLGDSGVIAITRYNNDMAVGEDKIIDRFWETLKLKKQ